jgi:hypothetical protein
MRQNMIIQALIIIGILLVLLISLYLFRGTILRSNSPDALKTLVQLFIPPIDLYQPLVSEGMDISGGFAGKKLSYRHKYMGNHEIGVLLGNFDPELYNLNLKLSANIVCDSNEGLHYTSSIKSGVPFLGKDGSGFGLVTYVVSKDLPLDSEISCIITISGIDADFIRKYGPARIYIKKISDM